LLLDSKNEDEAVFVYLNPNPNGDPYDLKVCSYQERNQSKYYTLSGKGLTLYENDNPVEFLSLGQWLIERDSYNHIKELSFFKKFKRWKFMRMWKKTVKRVARMKASNALEDKLFYLHPIFRKHLMKHRAFCTEMEKLRFVNISKNLETQTIADFSSTQAKCRSDIEYKIKELSDQCRKNITESISKVLSELRERIVSEIALDEERKKNNPI
jgi:dynein heavy chain